MPRPVEAEDRRRRARAMWSYSGRKQPDFARLAGIHPDRLRAAINDRRVDAPTLDELVAMARAADIPRQFAIDGWHAIIDAERAAEPDLDERVEALERKMDALLHAVLEAGRETALRDDVAALLTEGPGAEELTAGDSGAPPDPRSVPTSDPPAGRPERAARAAAQP